MILMTYYVLRDPSLGKQATRDPVPGCAFAGLLNSADAMRSRPNCNNNPSHLNETWNSGGR